MYETITRPVLRSSSNPYVEMEFLFNYCIALSVVVVLVGLIVCAHLPRHKVRCWNFIFGIHVHTCPPHNQVNGNPLSNELYLQVMLIYQRIRMWSDKESHADYGTSSNITVT